MNTTPQGWYRDPADSARVRWFDGQAWTANSRPAPEPGTAPLPPPAGAGSVPTPPTAAPMVIPELEPDEPDEYEDAYEQYEEPVAEPVVAPEPAQPEAAQPEQYAYAQPAAQPTYAEPAAQPAYAQPAAQPAYAQPQYATPPAQYGQGFAPAAAVPQQFTPAPPAPPAPSAPLPDQFGAAYAPASTTELPPYIPQPQPPAPGPAAPFGPTPFGQPPFGQAPAAYAPPPTTGPPAAGQPQFGPPGFGPPAFGQPATGWQGGAQPWAEPKKKSSTTKIVLIVVASVLVGLVLLGILAAIAIPVFLNQREKARAESVGLESVTCEQVADYAVKISAAGQAQGAGPLVSMTETTLVQDNRSTVRVPSPGSDPAFVLSCAGTGTQPDGTTAPVTANLYIDSTTQQLVAYAWDQ